MSPCDVSFGMRVTTKDDQFVSHPLVERETFPRWAVGLRSFSLSLRQYCLFTDTHESAFLATVGHPSICVHRT